jgi:hypothetical protein
MTRSFVNPLPEIATVSRNMQEGGGVKYLQTIVLLLLCSCWNKHCALVYRTEYE